jgi:adenylate cyclase
VRQKVKNLSFKFDKAIVIGLFLTTMFILLEINRYGPLINLKQRIEGLIYDVRLNVTLNEKPRKVDELVVIVDIDEKSMREQGRFPWSRHKVGQLVQALGDAGAIVVAFDIFFAEPENNPVDDILNLVDTDANLPKTNDVFSVEVNQLREQVDADQSFSAALADYDVVLGFLLMFDPELTVGGQLKTSVDWPQEHQKNSKVSHYTGAISNIDILQSSAIGLGFINAHADSDGFIRKAALVNAYQGKLYPSIALEAARLYTLSDQINTQSIVDETNEITYFDGLSLVDRTIKTDETGQIYIPYKGPAHSFPYISATDVLEGRVGEEQLEGSVVFIGTSAVGLADLRATPVGLQYPGVEVHANVFEGILHPDIVPFVPEWDIGFNIAQLFLLGITLSFLLRRRTAVVIVWVALFSLAIVIAFNFYFWTSLKISLPLLSPLLLILQLAIAFIISGFIAETKNKRSITDMFGQYVPPDHINDLIEIKKGGLDELSQRREMSVLFSDIRSFTSLSENLSAHELSEFLNEYLSSATQIIFDHQGTIDKYVGDMVMAFWNAPLDDKDHAQNSVSAAMSMIESLTEVNATFATKNWPQVSIGIGISTGEMNVGDMGSHFRKAYTVLGDSVNLGARLESLTKFYGVDILVSELTKLQCHDIKFRFIDKVQVVGKNTFVDIYEPIINANKNGQDVDNELKLHEKAINLYQNKKWDDAKEIMTNLKNNSCLATKLYDIYIERMETIDQASLAPDWSGEYTHKNK